MNTFSERLKYAMGEADLNQSALSEKPDFPRRQSANTFPGRIAQALTGSKPLPMLPAFPLIS